MALWGKKSKQPLRRQPRVMPGQNETSFQRSRTMSGREIARKQQQSQSTRLQEHARQRRNHIIKLTLVVLVVSAALIYWLATQYALTVSSISFVPAPTKNPEPKAYRVAIEDYLSKYPSERFRFLLNKERLGEYVGKKLPEVKAMKSSGGGIGYGDYDITLRQPIVSWQVGSRHYFVDSDGVAFSRDYFNAPSVSVVDQSGVKPSDSGVIASNRFLSFLGRVVSLADQTGLGQVEKIIIPPGVTRQADVYLKGKPYPIKTNVDRDPAQQIEDMRKVIDFLKQRGTAPSYIDVRVSGRTFYR